MLLKWVFKIYLSKSLNARSLQTLIHSRNEMCVCNFKLFNLSLKINCEICNWKSHFILKQTMRLYSFYQYGVTPYSLETRNFLLHFNLSSVIISIFKPHVLVGFYCLLSRQVFWPNFLWQIKASAVGISRAHAYITLNWRVVNYTNHSSRKKLHFFLFQGSRRQSLLSSFREWEADEQQ